MRAELLYPLKVAKVLRDDLQAVLAHIVAGEVDAGDPLHGQQRLHLLSALIPQAVVPQRHHPQAPHLHDPPQELPQRVLTEVLLLSPPTLSLKSLSSIASIMWNLLPGLKEVSGTFE